MFINETVIAVIFRLCNFGLIIALALYIFKKYMVAGIVTAMAKKKAEKEFLLNQQVLLEQKQIELHILVQQETDLCEHLKIKINEWKRIIEEQNFLQKKECSKRVDILEKKYVKKMEWQKKTA